MRGWQGLLLVRTSGEVETLVSADDHPSLSLCNDVTVDPATGHVYFTNTHDTFQVRRVCRSACGMRCCVVHECV